MSITTLDGVIAGLTPPNHFCKVGTACTAGRFRSMFYATGAPAAAAVPSPGVNGAALTTYAGQLPFTNPGGGNSYLARLAAFCTLQPGTLLLVDRLWHNSGLSVTLTSSQPIASGAFPARDRNGAVNGADVLVGLEVTSTMGAGTPNITLGYTNSNGTTGRSATYTGAPTTMAAGDFLPLPLQSGDVGVGAVESLQLSATMTSGSFSLVAYRVLAQLGMGLAGVDAALDALGTGLPRLYNDTVPFLLFLPVNANIPTIVGQTVVAQG